MSGRNAGHESADVAQSVERRLGKAEVTGSIPVISLNMQGAVHDVQHFFSDRDYQRKN